AEIESLGADRRHDVRRFADKRDTVARKRVCRLDRERKNAAARLDIHGAKQRMGAALDLAGEFRVVHRGKFGGVGRVEHADQARTPARQGYERKWPAFSVEFG